MDKKGEGLKKHEDEEKAKGEGVSEWEVRGKSSRGKRSRGKSSRGKRGSGGKRTRG